MKFHSWKYEPWLNILAICTNTFNEFQICAAQLVLRAAITRNEVFNGLHSASTSMLITFFVHVIDITPQNMVLVEDLTKLNKMFIDSCLIKALGVKI